MAFKRNGKQMGQWGFSQICFALGAIRKFALPKRVSWTNWANSFMKMLVRLFTKVPRHLFGFESHMTKGSEKARPFKQLLHWTHSGYLSGLPKFTMGPEAMGSYLGPSQMEYPSDHPCTLGVRLDLLDWHYRG